MITAQSPPGMAPCLLHNKSARFLSTRLETKPEMPPFFRVQQEAINRGLCLEEFVPSKLLDLTSHPWLSHSSSPL